MEPVHGVVGGGGVSAPLVGYVSNKDYKTVNDKVVLTSEGYNKFFEGFLQRSTHTPHIVALKEYLFERPDTAHTVLEMIAHSTGMDGKLFKLPHLTYGELALSLNQDELKSLDPTAKEKILKNAIVDMESYKGSSRRERIGQLMRDCVGKNWKADDLPTDSAMRQFIDKTNIEPSGRENEFSKRSIFGTSTAFVQAIVSTRDDTLIGAYAAHSSDKKIGELNRALSQWTEPKVLEKKGDTYVVRKLEVSTTTVKITAKKVGNLL